MSSTCSCQPMPTGPLDPAEPYCSDNDGRAIPRPAGSWIGTENPAIPVEGWNEKLSPSPPIDPAPCGSEIAWLDTFSPPELVGSVGSVGVTCGPSGACPFSTTCEGTRSTSGSAGCAFASAVRGTNDVRKLT